ncbi:uncharacterized protein LOC126672911 [Mercurialis annua]|uniref:uncharacterized protein LOC126672911 n=1 Tax=Mercurialis annua TaxID=3986 RepID=UPI0021600D52|nr:uncharacterized protein LOC126672911 [Mercurialis annua]
MKTLSEHKEEDDDPYLEILKAVAQAWHGHSGTSRPTKPTNEYDAHRQNFQTKPSRFKVEAMNKKKSLSLMVLNGEGARSSTSSGDWDFKQSLLDSYEIVSMAKRLESGMVLLDDEPLSGLLDYRSRSSVRTKRKESKNSLRSLFNRLSSRRFEENDYPPRDI